VQYAAPPAAGGAEKLDPNVPPIEESIARQHDLLIADPKSFPLSPDRHHQPAAGPARNFARVEHAGTV